MKLRELIDRHGTVVTPPIFLLGGKADALTAAIWHEYRDGQIARRFDEEDPYAVEVGGESGGA